MPRGDKSKYTDKQERMAEHIEDGYEKRGVRAPEAKRRAWATVNKTTGGGKKAGGSGRGKKTNKAPARAGGRKGGATKGGAKAGAAKRGAAKRSTGAAKRGTGTKRGAAKGRTAKKK